MANIKFQTIRSFSIAAVVASGFLLGGTAASLSADMSHGHAKMQGGKISAMDPWVPVAPPGVRTHAAYVTLHNAGTASLAIVSVSSPQYGAAEMHVSKVSDGIAMMHRLAQVNVPGGGMLEFKPGGLHIMLMKPKKTMAVGDVVELTLTFDDGSMLALKAPVKKRNAAEMSSGHHHGHSGS